MYYQDTLVFVVGLPIMLVGIVCWLVGKLQAGLEPQFGGVASAVQRKMRYCIIPENQFNHTMWLSGPGRTGICTSLYGFYGVCF